MKTTFIKPTIASGTNDVMPPLWGLGLIGNVTGYKHVAPLALGNTRRPITTNPIRI